MNDQRTHLKIKIKNLADEARTIRHEARKVHGMERWVLNHHRTTVVRSAARRSLIAYQHIRGRDPSCNFKQKCAFTRAGDYAEVAKMVNKYGSEEAILALPGLEAALKLTAPLVSSNEGKCNGKRNVG